MSTTPEYTSGSYFDRLQVQLELNVVSQYKGIMGNTAQNASQGVSPSISAVDTGIKAAMALSGALTSGIESAYLPALEALGLSGMACLPISKQLDPVVGVDCHIMIPGGPLPNPYIGLLLNPKDFLAVALASILPPPMPDEGASEGEGDGAKLLEMAHMGATMAIGMLGATVLVGGLPRVVAGTPTLTLPFHIPIGPGFTPPVHALIAKNHGHMFMGSLNYQDDLQRVEYAYEGMWKLVRRRDERGQLGFVYDSEERLLRVSNENWEHYHFELDDARFVIGERDFDRGYRSYQRDRAGRVIRETLPSGKFKEYEYDKDGQLTEKYKGSGKWWDTKRERWRYEWNQNGTLKAVKSPHRSNWVEFTYDALGRRLSKLASEYTHWVWNGNVPLHEWNSSREWKGDGWKHYELDLRTWVFEEESFVPMALLLNGKAYSIVTDQLGTLTEAYPAEGEEVWRRRLDMNGKILEEEYNRNAPYSDRIRIPFLFQGQYYDHETELAYNRFRYYSPELGRYISEDPIRFASGTLALHSYVEDVNSWVDVLGLSSYKKSSKSLLKEAELPRKGRMRFIPSKNDLLRGKLSTQKVGKKTGYVDKFGNVWVKEPSRTKGEAFEWDVQLTETKGGQFKRSGLSPDGKHLNVSLQGRITH